MPNDVKLTEYSDFSGCGAKLGPGLLAKALCGLAQPRYQGLLAGFDGFEDAGLFSLGDGRALVQTVDFFPPIVDDPFLFGRIAAANALSDVYAMGGAPLCALALVCFPVARLGVEALRRAMEGGLDAMIEAGCALVGGHSIEDGEPKLGYAVTGLVGEDAAWRNSTLEPGAVLLLTKPIGTGLVNMALRAGMASETARLAAERSMATLNKAARDALVPFEPLACTDVTGFGLLGHAAEMASGERSGLTIRFSSVPLLPDALEYSSSGLVPDGARRNAEGRAASVKIADDITSEERDVAFDPQTSGGLLVALEAGKADAALSALSRAGVHAAVIGVAEGPAGIARLER
jgi:selenide,water dikinase